MKTVTVREAQHHLSKVLEMVDKGEEVILTRRGQPVAKLSNIKPSKDDDDEVDWSKAIGQIRERLSHIPSVGESLVLEEREEYQW